MPQAQCFHMNFAKFIRTPFYENTSGQLLLNVSIRRISQYKALVNTNTERPYKFLLIGRISDPCKKNNNFRFK